MWRLLLSAAVLFLGHLGRPAGAECPPSQEGNDTGPCDCVTAVRIVRDCLRCPPELGCQCNSSEGLLNVTEFYGRACRALPSNAVYVAVVVPVMGLFLIAALTYFLVRSKKGAPLARDKPDPEAPEGRPRYAGQAGPRSARPGDYENVFVEQRQERGGRRGTQQSKRSSKGRPPRPSNASRPYGDQPIYANTEGVYYNYVRKPSRDVQEEGIYVTPDQ